MANEIQEQLDMMGGLKVLIIGAPGTGKSWMAGSIADFGPTKVHAFSAKEVDSYQYRSRENVDVELFNDPSWTPSLNKFDATGYMDWIRAADELLYDDEIENVIFDPLTGLHTLIKHEVLKKENAARMNEMSNSLGAWGDIGELWTEASAKIDALAHAPTPKNVIAVVHAKVPTEEDEGRRDVEFMGTTLPAIQGGHKTIMEGNYQIVLHSRVTHDFDQRSKEYEENYVVEVRANPKRHSKVSLVPRMPDKTVPNDMQSLLEAIKGAEGGEN